jgi:hypothetical protein
MFPFIGFILWMYILNLRGKSLKKILYLFLMILIAWVFLTTWGIIRSQNARDNPSEILRNWSDPEFVNQVLLGNELPTRMAFYDIIARPTYLYEKRGFESISATFLSIPYPFILRAFGTDIPTSNAKKIYEIQTGVIGSGVSTGVTVFGNDWFVWGWLGIIWGGSFMGILLYAVDKLSNTKSIWWFILGPMSTFQLIFFARGGADVWLGIWGRFLPITFLLIILAYALDKMNYKP